MVVHFLSSSFLCALLCSLVLSAPLDQLDTERAPHHIRGQKSTVSLFDASLDDLRAALDASTYTSVDLVKAYIARIGEVNERLHAVLEINPEAVTIAARLDTEARQGKSRGPLHGVPVLLKDNIGTADQLNTTCGSFALLGAKLPQDSNIAAKLRIAGAIILGKANPTQWSAFRGSNLPRGWSARGNQTLGAYLEHQSPAGSSSGSAVAASIGLAWATVGTDTSGSIIMPAASNSIVGIKPTVGLTSRNLVIPLSEHQDTAGSMARTVKDAAYLLAAIAGEDPADNYTSSQPFDTPPDYVAACDKKALNGVRIGVPRNLISDWSANDLNAFNTALGVLTENGAAVVDDLVINAAAADSNFYSGQAPIIKADFFANLQTYLSQLTTNPNSIVDVPSLRNFTRNHAREGYPLFDTGAWDIAPRNASIEPLFQSRYETAGTKGIERLLSDNNLDALIAPPQYAAFVASAYGGPIITVPLGYAPTTARASYDGGVNGDPVTWTAGFPYGIAFFGKRWSEEKLIAYAYAFEQATHYRDAVKPIVMPIADIGVATNLTNEVIQRVNAMSNDYTYVAEVEIGNNSTLQNMVRNANSPHMNSVNSTATTGVQSVEASASASVSAISSTIDSTDEPDGAEAS